MSRIDISKSGRMTVIPETDTSNVLPDTCRNNGSCCRVAPVPLCTAAVTAVHAKELRVAAMQGRTRVCHGYEERPYGAPDGDQASGIASPLASRLAAQRRAQVHPRLNFDAMLSIVNATFVADGSKAAKLRSSPPSNGVQARPALTACVN